MPLRGDGDIEDQEDPIQIGEFQCHYGGMETWLQAQTLFQIHSFNATTGGWRLVDSGLSNRFQLVSMPLRGDGDDQ